MLLFISIDGPSGGIDSIASALIYAFMFRIITFGLPALIATASLLMWLYHNQKKLFKYVVIAIPICIILYLSGRYVYDNHVRKMVFTPEYAAKDSYDHYMSSSYIEWDEEWNGIEEKYEGVTDTPYDKSCQFLHLLYDYMGAEMRSANINMSDDKLMEQYIDAIMQERKSELPVKVTDWQYVPRLSALVSTPSYSDDGDFLLNDSSYAELEEKFGRPLCSDHKYSRYYGSSTSQFYSWLSAVIVFYDNGTMDIVLM